MVTGLITVRHRGYRVVFRREDDRWYGKIEDIKDLVTVEAKTIYSMRTEAEMAIDDYIETCRELGVEPKEPAA